jgi:hypothetical protein
MTSLSEFNLMKLKYRKQCVNPLSGSPFILYQKKIYDPNDRFMYSIDIYYYPSHLLSKKGNPPTFCARVQYIIENDKVLDVEYHPLYDYDEIPKIEEYFLNLGSNIHCMHHQN